MARDEVGARYLELARELAKRGKEMTDDEVDSIYAEMRQILLLFDNDQRRDLVLIADRERRRILSRRNPKQAPDCKETPPQPFRFLCRIPRAEASNLADTKIGPAWFIYLKSQGIRVPFNELVIVNDPESTGSYLAYHVESGRLF